MKKLFLLLLIPLLVTVANAMDNLVNQCAWKSLVLEMTVDCTVQECDDQVSQLLGMPVDLNTANSRTNDCLLTALLHGIHAPTRDEQARNNARFMLKKLVEAERLNLELQDKTGQYTINQACRTDMLANKRLAEDTYKNTVVAISDEIYNAQQKKASTSHTHESSLPGLGIKTVRVHWHPSCLLVDYRFWTGLVAVCGLCAWYTSTKHAKDNDNESSDNDQQEYDETSSTAR